MCCDKRGGHGQQNSDFSCCCFTRRFLTKKEQIERIEEYEKSLEKELAGAKEYIEKLKKGGE